MSVTRHHGTVSALKTFWDEEAETGQISVRRTPAHPALRASVAAGESLRQLSPGESCAKGLRRDGSGRLGSAAGRAAFPPLLLLQDAPEPPRPRSAALSEGNPCPEQLRRRSPSTLRPPRLLLPSGSPHNQAAPTAAAGSPHSCPRARGRLHAYLRWSKEWMLRAAFPCPPPTQLRERPNMLAANGCYGLRRALRLHSPAGKGGEGRARGERRPDGQRPGRNPLSGSHRRTQEPRRMRGRGTPGSTVPRPTPAAPRGLQVPAGSGAGRGRELPSDSRLRWSGRSRAFSGYGPSPALGRSPQGPGTRYGPPLAWEQERPRGARRFLLSCQDFHRAVEPRSLSRPPPGAALGQPFSEPTKRGCVRWCWARPGRHV